MTNNTFSNKLNHYFKDDIRLSFVNRNVIVVTKEDKVYKFGKSVFRNIVFITSDKAIVDSIVEQSLVKQLCGKGVTDFKSGQFHTVARTVNGKVYCWGWNGEGILGNGSDDRRKYKPALNEYLSDKNVTDVCCGSSHSLALTIDGQVYAWGDNECGQIGNGKDSECEPTPWHVGGFDGEKVKAIACGHSHSMALTETGKVFSWGRNAHGQLGTGIKCRNWNSPKRIEMNDITVEKICCGSFHSLLLSHDRDIHVFGWNKYGELGTGVDVLEQITPKKLVCSSKFTNIESYWRYDISAAQSENGSYYIWGRWERNAIWEPKEAPFKSFDDIYEHYLQINYKPVEGRITPFNDTFIKNGQYRRRFNELGKLGEGSYGQVFKVCGSYCWNEFVYSAVKKVRFSTNEAREFLKELETCATIQGLRDEKLVKYRDIWVEDLITDESGLKDCTLYIEMELCDTNLKAIIAELKEDSNLKAHDFLTQLGYFVASELFIETLKGVQYLHHHNPPIIHRDLKPDNILLKIKSTGGTTVKIGDFGLAAFHEFAQQSHSADRGAIKYAAPEVLYSTKYDTKADVYSLGIIARELFDIDPNRENLNIPEILKSKFQDLGEKSCKMTDKVIRIRPNCEEILEAKGSWALNANEFDFPQFSNPCRTSNIVLSIIKRAQPNHESESDTDSNFTTDSESESESESELIFESKSDLSSQNTSNSDSD